MELAPIGTPTASTREPSASTNEGPVIALADTPAFAVARAADALRQEEENRKGRLHVVAFTGIIACATLIGLVVIIRFAAETRDKNQKFQSQLSQAYEARKSAERAAAANEQAQARAEARQAAEEHQRRIDDSQARAYNAQLLKQREKAAHASYTIQNQPIQPAQPAYNNPIASQPDTPPAAAPVVTPPDETPVDTTQAAKELLAQQVQSEYGGYRDITYRMTPSGFAAVVRFDDGDIASYINRGGGWIETIYKMNPALSAVRG